MRQISIGALHVIFSCMRDRSYSMTIRRVEDGKSKVSTAAAELKETDLSRR